MFQSFPALEDLFSEKVGLVGVAGSKIIDRQHPWWFNWSRLLKGQLSGSIYQGSLATLGIKSVFGKLGEVVVLDGVCLITPQETLKEVCTPNQEWASWDFYDHVLSLEYRRHGHKLITAPIKMFHGSTGYATGERFKRAQEMFVREYFADVDRYSVA